MWKKLWRQKGTWKNYIFIGQFTYADTGEMMIGYRKTDEDIYYIKDMKDFLKEFEWIGEIDD